MSGVDTQAFLRPGPGRTVKTFRRGGIVFAQGDSADTLCFVQKGKVKISTCSKQGKEAVVAILGTGNFFGEGAVAGQLMRISTATAIDDCSIVCITKPVALHTIHAEPAFSEFFVSHLLSRNIRMEADLIDQLFNSSEKRLARLLLILANFGREGQPAAIIPKISQQTLAEMVGTTRARISFFMNKFRKLGFIKYDGGLEIHSSLLTVILHDDLASLKEPGIPHFEKDPDHG
jgi:CRP-like cAMP-binding protein